MKKERIAIRVTTLPNGYSVDLEKESFMYYSPMALMEGLFVHVGMNREGAMTKEEMEAVLDPTLYTGRCASQVDAFLAQAAPLLTQASTEAVEISL